MPRLPDDERRERDPDQEQADHRDPGRFRLNRTPRGELGPS
jgi:hypothetical protein